MIGKWQTLRQLNLYSVVSPDKGANRSVRLQNIAMNLESFVRNNGEVFDSEDILVLQRFLFRQFNRPAQNENDYLISAYITDLLMRTPLDGIIYESVQSQDPGFKDVLCVALRPEVVDRNFSFVATDDHRLTYDPLHNEWKLSPAVQHIFAQ